MGSTSSKAEKNDALRLCKERRRYTKQAIDSRYNLAAAHVSYIDSLKNVGIALRRFVEVEVLIEPSLSAASATELENDKTPSHSSYPSPSPSRIADVSDSPVRNGSPISPPGGVVNLSYMRAGGAGSNAVTVEVNLLNNGSTNEFVTEGDESQGFSMPMPPPPPPDLRSGSSWDFFEMGDDCESFRFVGPHEVDVDFEDVKGWSEFRGGIIDNLMDVKAECDNPDEKGHAHEGKLRSGLKGGDDAAKQEHDGQVRLGETAGNVNCLALEQSGSRREKKALALKGLPAEREDPSEFITHRAKDFISSIKDIEHRFFRASESGREISRMLEANNIRIGYSEAVARGSPALVVRSAFRLVCCHGRTALVSNEPTDHNTKVINWKRTTSSRSSSSRTPLASATKDDVSDSGSDFFEDYCMIAGSNSSTLDRLYAWERKLFDEVKASESIRKEYDQRCDELRRQFAKDVSAQMIDKTRAVVKDLHSRIRVAIQSVDTISKRIEKMRDDELQPQLLELIQGLIRMWKAMLECHHAQYITISLAYHTRSMTRAAQGNSRKLILAQLRQEVECFGLGFANWVNSHAFYVESLNGWLQNCILLPQERSKHRRPFSPRRVLAPPIFVLCRDWSAGIKALPSEELSNAIKAFLLDLQYLMEEEAELVQNKEAPDGANIEENGGRDKDKNDNIDTDLCLVHASLTKVLDKLHKFSEASLKMYEDIKQRSEAAQVAYSNGRPTRY